jgi:3-oxoacyl-[acyl-carrier-protein] synthase II
MKQPLYIHAATAISPQQSFKQHEFLKETNSSDTGKLYAVEAPYAEYISPVAIRRMSRIMKITISTAMQCLKEAGVKTPDAIITGTGRGGVTDMEVFVKDMIRTEEGALNPTGFIQSTYNSPNGWIAMQSGATSYNQTYVHRGCSFELALLDAQMLAAENEEPKNILVGCYDEMTEDHFIIRSKLGYWKREPIDSKHLLENSTTRGTVGGEGAAFFLVNSVAEGASSCVMSLRIIHETTDDRIADAIEQTLKALGKTLSDISLVLTGLNGDREQSKFYEKGLDTLPKTVPVAAFKHLSGEYDTTTGFGLWLSNYIIETGVIPESCMLQGEAPQHITNVLFVNHYILGSSSVIFISKR